MINGRFSIGSPKLLLRRHFTAEFALPQPQESNDGAKPGHIGSGASQFKLPFNFSKFPGMALGRSQVKSTSVKEQWGSLSLEANPLSLLTDCTYEIGGVGPVRPTRWLADPDLLRGKKDQALKMIDAGTIL